MSDDIPYLAPHDLTKLVLDKINELGDAEAANYFGVSHATITAWKKGRNLPSLEAAQKVWDATLLCQTPEVWGRGTETIQLLLPMYESVEPLFLFTLIRCLKLYGIEKVSIIPKIRTLIDEARNDLAERALQSTSEWFVFADCDMIMPCGNGAMLRKEGFNIPEPKASRNALERLMSHPKEYRVVGALYRDRRGGTKAQCSEGFAGVQQNSRLLGLFDGKTQADVLEEMNWVGGGFFRVHRSVFEEMKEAAKPGGPLAEIAPPPPPRDREPYGFFGRTSQHRGEDVVFGYRCRKIGIKVWLDTGLLLGHRGAKIY